MTVLLTGATGFVGSFLAARLLNAGNEVVGLVRAADDDAAQARLDAALAAVGSTGGARALSGDLSVGVPALPEDITHVVHCAASVSFSMPLDESRAINVAGTERLLDAAASLPGLERFVHVSTAYVGGHHAGVFGEADHDLGQQHRNGYERSKWEAEAAVRASGLPAVVVRPSIVVGDSATGWTNSFNVLYFPLQAFARGLATRVPADPAAVVDVVPVDHVSDVIEAALDADFDGDTLHAVAGDRATTAGELARLASAFFGRPAPELIPPSEFDATGAALDQLEIYFPYFTVKTRFDDTRARALGLQAPHLPDYFDRLMEFARAARWGKRSIALTRT